MKVKQLKRSGYLFLLAGCAFIGAFYFGRQAASLGASAALFGVGIAYLIKGKKSSPQT